MYDSGLANCRYGATSGGRGYAKATEATGSGDKVSYTVFEFRFAFRLARVRQMDVPTGSGRACETTAYACLHFCLARV